MDRDLSKMSKNGKHLVLDIDETLVHSFSDEDNFLSIISNLTAEQKKNIYVLNFKNGSALAGYIRPHLDEFLDTVFSEFDTVGVWSAGTLEYVHTLVNYIFKKHKPKYILTRKDCEEIKLKTDGPVVRYKPLSKIYALVPGATENNTIIIDDRNDICKLNCLNNINVPEFFMTDKNYKDMLADSVLKILADWIKTSEFRNETSVINLKSKSPFAI